MRRSRKDEEERIDMVLDLLRPFAEAAEEMDRMPQRVEGRLHPPKDYEPLRQEDFQYITAGQLRKLRDAYRQAMDLRDSL